MSSNKNAVQFIGIFIAASFVLDVALININSDYTNELLFFHIPFVIWAAHIFPDRKVYIFLSVMSIVSSLSVLVLLFDGNNLFQSSQTLFMTTVCILVICELLFRSSKAKRMLDERNKKLILELQMALTQVKTLKGMLPICSYCNKVRDDEGSWSRIEEYIRENSEVDFTHSMCPECFQRELESINKKSKSKNSG